MTERFDQPLDMTNWHGCLTYRLRRTAWTLRYWNAGSLFRRRMLRSILWILAATAAALGVAAALD